MFRVSAVLPQFGIEIVVTLPSQGPCRCVICLFGFKVAPEVVL